jgi:hypothetical protein
MTYVPPASCLPFVALASRRLPLLMNLFCLVGSILVRLHRRPHSPRRSHSEARILGLRISLSFAFATASAPPAPI